MAYDTNSLVTIFPRLGEAEGGANAGKSSAMHIYRSTDNLAAVVTAGYIDDGNDKGIRVNDIVAVIDDDAPTGEWAIVTVVDSAGDVTMIAFD